MYLFSVREGLLGLLMGPMSLLQLRTSLGKQHNRSSCVIAKELKELLKNIDDEAEVVYSDGKLVYNSSAR